MHTQTEEAWMEVLIARISIKMRSIAAFRSLVRSDL